jgi:hypothetical protein
MSTGCLRSKSGCRDSESGSFHAVTFFVPDDHSSFLDHRLRHFSISPKVSFCKCPHNREAFPDDCFSCQRNYSERIGDEKILAALGPSFLERCLKVSPVEAAKNVKDFAGVRNE